MDPQTIKQLIEEVLGKLCVSCDSVELTEDAATKRRQFSITSSDSNLLIGTRGENLAALNHIVRALARRHGGDEDDELNFSIDVNNYRRSRVEAVLTEAREAAERARLFLRPIELSPMSSYERLVVHSFFSDVPDVTTESFGEGRFRRVVVKCATGEESNG
ncbi:MAG: R3H domain-containing nucleic acid-binding protein [bacterium]|nr:R3H domain-containing nucleic acid-binding protein [bacterium]